MNGIPRQNFARQRSAKHRTTACQFKELQKTKTASGGFTENYVLIHNTLCFKEAESSSTGEQATDAGQASVNIRMNILIDPTLTIEQFYIVDLDGKVWEIDKIFPLGTASANRKITLIRRGAQNVTTP